MWLIILIIILIVAFVTLLERKVLAIMQRRIGPNVVGLWGLMQPLLDGIKLILKRNILISYSKLIIYVFCPIFLIIINIILFYVIPLSNSIIISKYLNIDLLFIYGLSSLTIIFVIFSGWSNKNSYSIISTIRCASQLISYEISFGLVILIIILINNSFNLQQIIYNQILISNIFIILPIFIIYLISLLAETNRTPFDLLEAESELIAGFLIEYSSLNFVLFYLSEYISITFLSMVANILFFGNYALDIISYIIIFIIIWIRATLPRLKYNQLIYLGWLHFLPFTISYILFIIPIIFILQ